MKVVLGRSATAVSEAARGLRWRLPLTTGLVLMTITAGIITSTLDAGFYRTVQTRAGWDLGALRQWQLYRLWAGLPFGSLPGIRPTMVLLLALGPGMLEWRRGTRSAAMGFFILGPLLSLLSTLALWLAYSWAGWPVARYLFVPDLGSSTASLACFGIAAGGFGRVTSLCVAALTVGVLCVLWIVRPEPYVVDHLAAFSVAYAVTPLTRPLWRRYRPPVAGSSQDGDDNVAGTMEKAVRR